MLYIFLFSRTHQHNLDLRVFVEAAMDFPDEEIDFLADSDVLERLGRADSLLHELADQAHQGQLLRDGINIAIAGLPNAGKSSLLNALAGRESAIVTDIPGTTRDVLREYISLDGLPVHVADTAGIRDSTDKVEAEGVRRARATVLTADLVLLVIDSTLAFESQLALKTEVPDNIPCIEVYNEVDLTRTPLTSASMDISINQFRFPVSAGDTMSQQRTVHSLRGIAMANTYDLVRRYIDQLSLVHVAGASGSQNTVDWVIPVQFSSGTTAHPDFAGVAINSVKAPTYNRHYVVNGTGLTQGGAQATSAVSTDDMQLEHIDQLATIIADSAIQLQPVQVADDPAAKDEPMYVLYLSERQWNTIQTNTSGQVWRTFLQGACRSPTKRISNSRWKTSNAPPGRRSGA